MCQSCVPLCKPFVAAILLDLSVSEPYLNQGLTLTLGITLNLGETLTLGIESKAAWGLRLCKAKIVEGAIKLHSCVPLGIPFFDFGVNESLGFVVFRNLPNRRHNPNTRQRW